MSEIDTQSQMVNRTSNHHLGSSYSILFEAFLLCVVTIPILIVLIMFVVAGFTKSPYAFIGVVPVGIILLVLVSYTGGLRYEIANGNLVIKGGFFRRLIEKIPLDNIVKIEISDQIKFQAQSNFWFNYQPNGYGGFYKVYNRNFKRNAVMVQTSKSKYKYLLGSRNVDTLKAQIEQYVNVHKDTNIESS